MVGHRERSGAATTEKRTNPDKSIECGTIASGRPGQELSFKTVLLAAADGPTANMRSTTKATRQEELRHFLVFFFSFLGGASFFSWAVIPLPMFHSVLNLSEGGGAQIPIGYACH